VVGYSKLLVDEEIELLQELKHIVHETESFRAAEASGKLIRVPMGDGMALLFLIVPKTRCDVRSKSAKRCRIQQIDSVEHIGEMQEVGQALAQQKVKTEHFSAFPAASLV